VSEGGFTHSYLTEEKIALVKTINMQLEGDEDVKHLIPVNPENDDVFSILEDGIVLW